MESEWVFSENGTIPSPYPELRARIYISEKYNQVLFVPMGCIKDSFGSLFMETFDIKSDNWPCDFGDLEKNIEVLLRSYKSEIEKHDTLWPAQKASRAKTKKTFNESYILLTLNSDNHRLYEPGEGERIFVKTQASPLETTYYLVALESRKGSDLAQAIVDMFSACMKIRS
jgi:hypothetical protein